MNLGPRYRFVRELGQGGSGRVYLVHDAYLGKELALKLLRSPPGGAGALEQIEREFRLLARIRHPRIARAYDFGRLRGRPYFTREHVPGKPLGGPGDFESAAALLRCMAQMTEAVAFLHESEVLYLDLKPANVILRPEGASVGPVLIDFGLCRQGLPAARDERVRGSLPYMAPEHLGPGTLGPWTDAFALGVTFHVMISGGLPRRRPEPPAGTRWRLPPGIADLVLKCLAHDWRQRYPSALEVLEDLRRLLGGPAGEAAAVEIPAPTVGRDVELETIDAFVESLATGGTAPRAILLTGPAGMGQTHLLRELKVRAQTRGLRVFLETGYPGQTTPPGSLLR
ncbi:MAG: serine/threonine-protein kinase PknK [Planctomycetes bacterium]|nr:serine/threonine-protein kinase PknK [Planctomycetota bacterium]